MLKSLKKRFFNFFRKKEVEETQKKEISSRNTDSNCVSEEIFLGNLWVEEYILGPNEPRGGSFLKRKKLESYRKDFQLKLWREKEAAIIGGTNPCNWSGTRYVLVE